MHHCAIVTQEERNTRAQRRTKHQKERGKRLISPEGRASYLSFTIGGAQLHYLGLSQGRGHMARMKPQEESNNEER